MKAKLTKFFDSNVDERIVEVLVIISVLFFFIETDALHSLNGRTAPSIFLWIERVIASIFTIEFGLRLWIAPNKKDYLFSNRGIFDLVAILPFWIGFFVPVVYLDEIRALRILRLFKFYRYSKLMVSLGGELRKQAAIIKVISFIALTNILFTSALVHACEREAQPDKFGTILGTAWWSVITMTTVGYGDMAPITTLGKFCATGCMALGLIAFAAYMATITNVVTKVLHNGTNDQSHTASSS